MLGFCLSRFFGVTGDGALGNNSCCLNFSLMTLLSIINFEEHKLNLKFLKTLN